MRMSDARKSRDAPKISPEPTRVSLACLFDQDKQLQFSSSNG